MKKMTSILAALVLALTALCGISLAEEKTYTVGICNYVDHASLNQIVSSLKERLAAVAEERGVTIRILDDNANADGSVMQQIISNFIAEEVDLMVGVATPVAMTMQGMTEDNGIPVVFAAVSDPLAVKLVETLEEPGANITGTSDYLNTDAIIELIFAANPGAKNIALLFDAGQDASATPIAAAKALLDAKGVSYKEYNGSSQQEVILAADAIIADGADAVFTPTDNTIMDAELAIAEKLAEAKIPHYAGADSFALNGAFLGFGVDYAELGRETANTVAAILLDGADPAKTPVKTFDNGIATVNTETAEAIGIDYEAAAAAFAPFCTVVQPITTAENFE